RPARRHRGHDPGGGAAQAAGGVREASARGWAMNARAARRGFTALELMMATAIGAVVLLAALGVFGMMERMDRFHAQRFRESSDLVFAHTVLERAMQTLVAK